MSLRKRFNSETGRFDWVTDEPDLSGYVLTSDLPTVVPANETDPIFSAWRIATPPLYTETDPLSWSIASDQTLLTGDKTGSFFIDTTGYLYSHPTYTHTGAAAGGTAPDYASFLWSTLSGGTSTGYGLYGINGQATIDNTSPGTAYGIGLRGFLEKSGTGTVTSFKGIDSSTLITDGVITNLYGAYISSPLIFGGTITNNYGIYIEDQGGVGGTLNYAIYSLGGNVELTDGNLTTTGIATVGGLNPALGTGLLVHTTGTGVLSIDTNTYLTSVAFADLTDYPADAAGALTNDGSGNLSWAPAGSSVSFGTTTQIPYMNAGGTDFIYSANLLFNGTRLSPNYVTLAAGTTTAGTSPLKFTSGTLLGNPEAGVMEYNTDDYYLTMDSAAAYTSQYPTLSDTYVKATNKFSTSYWQYYAFDPSKPLTGNGSGNCYSSADTTPIAIRIHADLGSAKTITRIYYENYHGSGTGTDAGAQNFTFWGSNDAADFADLVYANNGTWTQITTSQSSFDRHADVDAVDPKYITLTNTTAYRYYAFKVSSNWGFASPRFAIRRIELQIGGTKGRNPIVVSENVNLTSGRIPYATTNGRLLDTSNFTYSPAVGYRQSGSADVVQWKIKANATQTANIFEIRSSADLQYWGWKGDGTLYAAASNIEAGTSTGMKIGVATNNKLGFWNATPIVQPVNTVAIDTLLVNTGLRATGGTANFVSKISTIVTTEQMRLGYDANNYVKYEISSTGSVTETATGTNTSFNFVANAQSTIARGLAVNTGLIAGATGQFVAKGSTDNSLIITDTTNDRVGIGVASPTVKLDVGGSMKCGAASTDTITMTGRFIPRSVAADPTANATAGTVGEIVYYSDKWYGKTTGSGTDTNWSALN